MNGLALCAGIGGLELGLSDALGVEPVCYVEREPFAAAVLVARMDDGAIPRAPIWDDLRTFDARAWRGAVDCVSAGYPCQPFSLAGSRRGEQDERHLWPEVRRILDESGAWLGCFENVRGHLSLGFSDVLADLADLGFDAEWGVLSAGDVGAPHERARLWILAHSDVRRRARNQECAVSQNGNTHTRSDVDGRGDCGHAVADADADGARRAAPWRGLGQHSVGRPGARRGALVSGAAHWPPTPGNTEAWAVWDGPQPAVRRGPDGIPARVDMLRALGNAVVPAAAAAAFAQLARRGGVL